MGRQPGRAQRVAVAGATGLIGSQVAKIAAAHGHDVVPLSRRDGVDLTDPASLGDRLIAVNVLIDVTRPSSMDQEEASTFFTTVAKNLGVASRTTGVSRTVVLSIVGIEESQDYGWYVATLAHERATRELADGVRVLRATQFHEFPGQVLARSRHGPRAQIMDMPIQPVASTEVARLLVEMATDDGGDDTQLAGPRRENLVGLARQLVAMRHEHVEIEPIPAPASMASGSVLPGPEALVRGVDWKSWARGGTSVDQTCQDPSGSC